MKLKSKIWTKSLFDWKSRATVVAGTGSAVEGPREEGVALQKKRLKLRILVNYCNLR